MKKRTTARVLKVRELLGEGTKTKNMPTPTEIIDCVGFTSFTCHMIDTFVSITYGLQALRFPLAAIGVELMRMPSANTVTDVGAHDGNPAIEMQTFSKRSHRSAG